MRSQNVVRHKIKHRINEGFRGIEGITFRKTIEKNPPLLKTDISADVIGQYVIVQHPDHQTHGYKISNIPHRGRKNFDHTGGRTRLHDL